MSDFASGLPVRTESPGDVVAKIVDATVPSQGLNVDSSGRITSKLDDGSGNAITSQANGGQRALDVGIDVAGVQVDPRQIRALIDSDIVTAAQGTAAASSGGWPVKLTDGTSVTAVKASSTAALAADPSAVVALSPNSPLPTGSNVVGAVTQSGTWSVRTQDGLGNLLTSAVAGSTRPLDVALRDGAGALYTSTNPLPVFVSTDNPGSEINDYNTSAALAAAATSNHDYTVTAAKTLFLNQINASGSGKMKIEVQIETAAASGTFNTKFVLFNSTASPNMEVTFSSPITVVAGAKVRVIRTNKDNQSQDVYSTISGNELP